MTARIHIDGSHGEGGGQILRTALALSALTGRAVTLDRIRAGRRNPGLRPQHLAVVRAMAAICSAHVESDAVDSRTLSFAPTTPPVAGHYALDIGEIAGRGSAGSVTLLLQALLVPLALAEGDSRLELVGGTHVRWSPPYHYVTQVYLPILARIGIRARLELPMWGWYPRGGGRLVADITGRGRASGALSPLDLTERAKLLGVEGLSAASNLPKHVMERQRDQALQRLRSRHIKGDIEMQAAPSPGPGTMLFLRARYEGLDAGFVGYGRLRYPAERVADDAFEAFDAHRKSRMALDPHLADQVLLPLCLAPSASIYTTSEITRHLMTNAWVIEHFLEREITLTGEEGQPGTVRVAALASSTSVA